jgi:hypothetical protein
VALWHSAKYCSEECPSIEKCSDECPFAEFLSAKGHSPKCLGALFVASFMSRNFSPKKSLNLLSLDVTRRLDSFDNLCGAKTFCRLALSSTTLKPNLPDPSLRTT